MPMAWPVLPTVSLSAVFWGVCFFGHDATCMSVEASLLWGMLWGGRQSPVVPWR